MDADIMVGESISDGPGASDGTGADGLVDADSGMIDGESLVDEDDIDLTKEIEGILDEKVSKKDKAPKRKTGSMKVEYVPYSIYPEDNIHTFFTRLY